ncbi:MAG: EcsC family protein [Thermoanaerobaculia bacterium]|nr:EcsC family protein [Thermoanaerobaculia bacterium]
MINVRNFKRRADSILEDVFRALFEEIDTDKLRAEIAKLKLGAPEFAANEHARTLARRTAIRCAAAGAVTGIPAIGPLAIGTLGADLAYLVYQQFRMILGIATIYGHEPSSRERFTEALSCLAFSGGVGVGKQGLATVLGAATEGGMLAERIGTRFVRERFARIVPFVGIISGGALNYAAVHAVSRSAIRYYESRVDPILADEIWAEGDRDHA